MDGCVRKGAVAEYQELGNAEVQDVKERKVERQGHTSATAEEMLEKYVEMKELQRSVEEATGKREKKHVGAEQGQVKRQETAGEMLSKEMRLERSGEEAEAEDG